MALINCPECGKEISDQAKACVHCGYPIRKQKPASINMDESVELPKNAAAVVDPVDARKRWNLLIGAVVALVIIGVVVGVVSHFSKEQRYARDLGGIFGFDFGMNIEAIIEYEAQVFGHTEYDYDSENNRLDFAPTVDGNSTKWRHRYFFDDETGLLTSANYMDALGILNDSDDARCEHIKQYKNSVLNTIGQWDEETHEGLFKTAYASIDGVRCNIKYQDGSEKAIFIHAEEE